jgi:hypothetical protein
MTEVLYCPKTNEIYLSYGTYSFDGSTMTLTLYLMSGSKELTKINAKDLVHLGWL